MRLIFWNLIQQSCYIVLYLKNCWVCNVASKIYLDQLFFCLQSILKLFYFPGSFKFLVFTDTLIRDLFFIGLSSVVYKCYRYKLFFCGYLFTLVYLWIKLEVGEDIVYYHTSRLHSHLNKHISFLWYFK